MEERETILLSEDKMLEVKFNECVNDDFSLLTDEKFDFSLSLSPASEHEDEVFVGPMGHTERCIAVSLEAYEAAEDKVTPPVDELTWSPLAGEKFVEIFKEAHFVALQLTSGSKPKREGACQLEEQKAETVEKFVQESKSKLKIIERGIDMEKTPRAVKRETYCVWESPLSQLPPSFQKHSQLPFPVMDTLHSPQMPINASSPLRMDKLTKIAVVPATVGHSDKNNTKMSQLQPVRTLASRNDNHVAVEQAKHGRLPSSSSRNRLGSTGSLEDLLSDKSSIASHVGESSFCSSSSVHANKFLSTPSKVPLGIKATQLKPSNIRTRRDTSSSSSSSLSSMNSSLNSSRSISPKRGKVASLGPKAPANSSRLSFSTSKISVVRPMRVSSASHSDVSGIQPTNSSVNVPKCKTTFSAKNSEPSVQKLLQKSTLANRRSSMPTTKTVPTLSTKEVKNTGISSKNAAAKVLQPIGFLSSGNIRSNVAFSPPIPQSEDKTTSNSCLVVKPTVWTPASIKHSALPTPISRRLSGIPVTPKTLPRLKSALNPMPVRQVSSVSSKKSLQTSSNWTKENKTRFTSSSSSAEDDLSWPQVVPVALDFSPEKTSIEKEQDLTRKQKPAEETQAKEGILIDIEIINKMPIITQEYENKPLIDLFNTPEIIKIQPLKPTGQVPLIDLSSPLISLSPEGNKENLDSPLLKF